MNCRQFLGVFIVCGLLALAGCKGADFGSPAFSTQGDGFRLLVNNRGAMSVEVDGESYIIESFYSYPWSGGKIGTNELSSRRQVGEWKLDIQKRNTAPGQVRIIGKGEYYTLIRTILVEGSRIGISDEIINETNDDVGIIIRHQVLTDKGPREILFGGAPWTSGKGIKDRAKDIAKRIMIKLGKLNPKVAYQSENPTLFISLKKSHLGIVAEDTLSRLQFEAHRYRAAFSMEHFSLSPNVSRTLQWAIYPLENKADYFTFINRVRRDWNSNFTIPGPWDFFNAVNHQEDFQIPGQLADYLNKKRIRYKIVTFTPWLDYDNYSWRTGTTVKREEYRTLLRSGRDAFRLVDPEIKSLGSIQSVWRLLPEDVMAKFYEKIPQDKRKQGYYEFTDEQMEVVQALPASWRESFVKGPEGRYIYELYYTGPSNNEPFIAIGVYAAPWNSQFAYWMEQARFIMEDVGLDGVYIDNFNIAFKSDPSQRYTYDLWDGVTVDIDPDNGKILRRYTDCAWVGVQAQKSLIQYVHSRGGILVANTASSAREVQSEPVMRFIEAGGVMSHFDFVEGKKPPLSRFLCRGQLASPIALGWGGHLVGMKEDDPGYSRKLMTTAITYLRHGLLYYYYGHYGVQGGKPGQYGAVNHMFPITPVRLGEGFVEGEERVVTAVSGKFSWKMDREPRVLCFNMANHPKKANFTLQKEAQGWNVILDIKDWQEICIVE